MRGLDFFENILPEGPALERMAALAGVRPVDTYGILRVFGRDCAGAIMVLPDGERPGGNGPSGYSPMTPGDLRRVIRALDVAPLGAGQPMQADTHLAQRVGGQADIRKVTAADLIDEAATWGIRQRAASAAVTEILDQVLTAIPAIPGDARVLAVIREQATRIIRG